MRQGQSLNSLNQLGSAIEYYYDDIRASQVALVVTNLPANAGEVGDVGSVLGSRRSPGERHGNPLHYSCLENPMDRGAC